MIIVSTLMSQDEIKAKILEKLSQKALDAEVKKRQHIPFFKNNPQRMYQKIAEKHDISIAVASPY